MTARFFRELADRVFYPDRALFKREHRRWLADDGEKKRFTYEELGPQSLVFDFGGYHGTWADEINRRYGSRIEIFEPHPAFVRLLEEKFAGNETVSVNPFGLGGDNVVIDLSDDGDASSALTNQAGATVKGEIRSVSDFMRTHGMPVVDLTKINIEGGEYDLLQALISTGLIERFERLQIQFHLFSREHAALREQIRSHLAQTHECEWCYAFVWEQWRKR